jgi:hypothetical protein
MTKKISNSKSGMLKNMVRSQSKGENSLKQNSKNKATGTCMNVKSNDSDNVDVDCQVVFFKERGALLHD